VQLPLQSKIKAITVIFLVRNKILFSLNNYCKCYSQNNDMSKKILTVYYQKNLTISQEQSNNVCNNSTSCGQKQIMRQT